MVFVYFCIPETLGRSLEEIQVMMDMGVKTRQWPAYRVDSVDSNFGQDEFRSSAKRAKMVRAQSMHVEKAGPEVESEGSSERDIRTTRI